MKWSYHALALVVILMLSSPTIAGFTTAVQNGIASAGPRGVGILNIGPDNGWFTHTYAGPEFVPQALRVIGDLSEVNTGTHAREAVFEVCNPNSCVALGGASLTSTTNYTGTIHINRTVVLPAGLSGSSIGTWTFEAFETFNDAGIDSMWNNLTIEVIPVPTPAPPFTGDFTSTPHSLSRGVTVSGTTQYNQVNPFPGLSDGSGELALGTRYGSHNFDYVGNEIGYRINHTGGDLILDLDGMSRDLDLFLLDASGEPASGLLALSEEPPTIAEHIELLNAAPGTYYAVIDTFGSLNPGSDFVLTYTPEPSSLALLLVSSLIIHTRRRCSAAQPN